MSEETELVSAIRGKLEEAGYVHTPGTNEFRAPSEPGYTPPPKAGGPSVAADQLRLFIERIERLLEEKKDLADDIRDVFAEAKSNGYDAPTMREMIKLRKMETHIRQEREALIETYQLALGL